jgi:hypothetical protein
VVSVPSTAPAPHDRHAITGRAGKRYLDWKLDDPAGQGIDAVRPIRDAIMARVERLLSEPPVKTG